MTAWLRAMRAHQWVKNVLVFLTLMAAHHWQEAALVSVSLAFVAFGLCASSVYLLNDLVDLESDRRHPRKRNRPFAAGALPISHGLAVAAALVLAAFAVALLLVNAEFAAWLLSIWW